MNEVQLRRRLLNRCHKVISNVFSNNKKKILLFFSILLFLLGNIMLIINVINNPLKQMKPKVIVFWNAYYSSSGPFIYYDGRYEDLKIKYQDQFQLIVTHVYYTLNGYKIYNDAESDTFYYTYLINLSYDTRLSSRIIYVDKNDYVVASSKGYYQIKGEEYGHDTASIEVKVKNLGWVS